MRYGHAINCDALRVWQHYSAYALFSADVLLHSQQGACSLQITQNPKTFPWGLLFHVKGPTRGCYTVITSTVVRRLLYTARKRMLKFLYIYGGGGHGPLLPPDLVLWMSQSVPPSVMSFMLLLFTEEMMLPAVCWCSCSLCWVDC